ncbi:glutathionylspermidine synthase family protein [Paraburkholderia sp. BCC1876]|uniref:glutathionylspermidine synthase family protein n=1 Tax=Paraburkholderia sp. BCC1876 TaxID=2676303 RepID=UPI001591B7E6|nr:glutathionylspermidine synthase family protein [Paraburkholderia sp. BCC1876]
MLESFSGSGDFPVFDPEKDWITLGQDQSKAELNRAYAYVQERAIQDRLSMSFEGDQSRAYPVMSGFCALHAATEEVLSAQIKTVFDALQKIVATYRTDKNLQHFLDIPKPLNRWIKEDAQPSNNRIDLCRFDLMGRNLAQLKIIEFNANAPGGIVYAGMINRYWRQAPWSAELIESWGGAPSAFEREDWVADWLSALADARGMEAIEGIALLHPAGGNMLELPHLKKRLEARGLRAAMLSPEQLFEDADSSFRLGYLKYGVQRALQDIGQWDRFCRSVVEGRLVIPSSLAGRWIGDNKLCIAVMSDPRFAYLFDDAERAAIHALVPLSRKLGDGVSRADLLNNKDDFVIKHPYGTRGAAVHVGRDYDAATWTDLIMQTSSSGYVVQRFVDSECEVEGETCFRDLVVTIASGEIAGYGSRVSRARKVNIAQEGRKMAVLSSLRATR